MRMPVAMAMMPPNLTLASEPKYASGDFNAPSENVAQATDGLKAGATAIVRHIVSSLR